MAEEQNSRFSGASWYQSILEHNINPIQIWGTGGIGSWSSLFLARAGFDVQFMDNDYLELGNFSGQFFTKEGIGMSKVKALYRALTDTVIARFGQDFIPKTFFLNSDDYDLSDIFYISSHKYTIICSCFDNMTARKNLFKSFLHTMQVLSEREEQDLSDKFLFIDGGLSMEYFRIYCIKGNDEQAKTKYSNEVLSLNDNDFEDDVCSMKQTSHIAAMIGAQITSFITNFISNKHDNVEAKLVPYKYEYFAPLALSNQIVL